MVGVGQHAAVELVIVGAVKILVALIGKNGCGRGEIFQPRNILALMNRPVKKSGAGMILPQRHGIDELGRFGVGHGDAVPEIVDVLVARRIVDADAFFDKRAARIQTHGHHPLGVIDLFHVADGDALAAVAEIHERGFYRRQAGDRVPLRSGVEFDAAGGPGAAQSDQRWFQHFVFVQHILTGDFVHYGVHMTSQFRCDGQFQIFIFQNHGFIGDIFFYAGKIILHGIGIDGGAVGVAGIAGPAKMGIDVIMSLPGIGRDDHAGFITSHRTVLQGWGCDAGSVCCRHGQAERQEVDKNE